jgi:hypothetical protein
VKRALATAASLLIALAASLAWAPGASGAGVAGYGMSALATGVRYQLNSPGFLPVGDPAEGTILELDIPIARTGLSQGPLINALASPAYPGDTVAHLGTAIGTFVPEFNFVPNYPVTAEANYPPTPFHGGTASFGQSGVGDGTAVADANGAKVVANTVAQSIGGVIDVGSSTVRNEVKVGADVVRSSATSVTSGISIAGMITIDGVIGTAEATSDGAKGVPKAALEIGAVTVAGQAAYIDRDGVHVASSPVVGAGVVAGLQAMVNAALNTDGIKIRTVAPVTTVDAAAATASAGALVITLERTLPAVAIPGVPALEIPGSAPLILGTPDLPTRIEVTIGEARVAANATSLTPIGDIAVPPVSVAGDTSTSGGGFTDISGAGASLGGALSAPSETGQSALGLKPTSERGAGKGIPTGWVIVGIFGAFVISGPLLGYARWQLLEGRHR